MLLAARSRRGGPRPLAGAALAVALLASVACDGPSPSPVDGSGLRVVATAPGEAGQRAGVRRGDELLSWRTDATRDSRTDRGGPLPHPFELLRVERREALAGEVLLQLRRDGVESTVRLPPGRWGLEARPGLPADLEAAYRAGRQALAAGDLDRMQRSWRAIVAELRGRDRGEEAAWVAWRVAAELLAAGAEDAGETAAAAVEEATALAGEHLQPAHLAVFHELLAEARADRADPAPARHAWERAIELWRSSEPGGLSEASALRGLGTFLAARGEADEAAARLDESLALRRRAAPHSLAVADSLARLGNLARSRGRLARAGELLAEARAIAAERAPDGLERAAILNTAGIVEAVRGDLAGAQERFESAAAIERRLAPDSLQHARTLNSLGLAARLRGDLATAVRAARRAVEIAAHERPGGLDHASYLNSLGAAYGDRGEYAPAIDAFRRALDIRRRLAPESMAVARSLNALAVIHSRSGEWRQAAERHREALAIKQRLAPESADTVTSLNNLAEALLEVGESAEASRLLERALAVRRRQAPGSLDVASTLALLGAQAEEEQRWSDARRHHRRALAIRERLAPGSLRQAESLHALGRVAEATGQRGEALGLYLEAVDALELQTRRLGGAEELRSQYRAGLDHFYEEPIRLLVDLARPAEAFELLERHRARGLLILLASRDLSLAAEVPEELRRELDELASAYDRTLAELGRRGATPEERVRVDGLLARRRELQARRLELLDRLRRAAPRAASLEAPRTATASEAAAVIGAGTCLLSYAVTPESLLVFRLEGSSGRPAGEPSVHAATVPVGGAELRREVEAFRLLLQSPRSSPRSDAPLARRGRRLARLLLAPGDDQITAGCQRLLVAPDGPLHLLPFAALVTDPQPGRTTAFRPRFLVDELPVHSVLSATLYRDLAAEVRGPAPGARIELAAFGDPELPSASAGTSPAPREPLPGARAEVAALAALYGEGESATLLGAAASEEAAKTLGPRARRLHFATHATLDRVVPLDSGLWLSPSATPDEGGENGYLQAWEIFDQMRLQADLVVLSACESALGEELGGEGLVGLTRAFQYAGAGAVVASLWRVADPSTGALMVRFYAHLEDGLARDRALRLAQLELLAGPIALPRSEPVGIAALLEPLRGLLRRRGRPERRLDASHPYHWAAFQVFGRAR